MALFFITLIFPIQFSHQWITIGWALEGAALLWLFHRVPHPGLRLVGRRPARCRVRPARVQSRRARIPFARRDADFQLVSLRLRHRDHFPVRRVKTARAAAKSNFRNQCAADSRRPWNRAGISAAEHRNRRLFQPARLDAHVPVQRRFRARHDLFHRLGAVRAGAAGRRHLKKIPAARYAAMALLCITLLKLSSRPRPTWPALPHRRVHRRGGHRDAGVVRVSKILFRNRQTAGDER